MQRPSAKRARSLSKHMKKGRDEPKRKAQISLPTFILRKGETTFLRWIRDFLEIYTWKEVWLAFSFPAMIVGFWLLFSSLLGITNDTIRTIAIWSLIFLMTLGSAGADYLRRKQASEKA